MLYNFYYLVFFGSDEDVVVVLIDMVFKIWKIVDGNLLYLFVFG